MCNADEAEEFSKEIDNYSSLCAILYVNLYVRVFLC